MRRMIIVTPTKSGWTVQADPSDDVRFESGGQAEAAARRMAQAQAETGYEVELRIYLRDGSLGGRMLYEPSLALAS